MKVKLKKGRYIFLSVGFAILFLLIRAFGVETTINKIREIGSGFWIIVTIFFFTNIFLTLAWRVLVPCKLEGFHFHKFVLARLAGDSTTSINALGAVAGEPLKAMYIKDIVPMEAGLASVVLDRTIKTVSSILITITGIFVSMFILDIPPYITAVTLLVGLISLFFMLAVLKKQKNGFLESLMKRLPSGFIDRIMNDERREKVRALDEEISYIFSSRENLHHFYFSLFLHYFTIVISCSAEIYLIAHYLNIQGNFTVFDAFFVYIFGFILTSLIFFMPANVGTSEGSYSLALSMLGFEPVLGLSIGIIRRLRTFFWAGIGILLLFYAGLLRKDKP